MGKTFVVFIVSNMTMKVSLLNKCLLQMYKFLSSFCMQKFYCKYACKISTMKVSLGISFLPRKFHYSLVHTYVHAISTHLVLTDDFDYCCDYKKQACKQHHNVKLVKQDMSFLPLQFLFVVCQEM